MPDKPKTSSISSNIYNEYEYVEELKLLDDRVKKYNAMRKSDSTIGGLMRAIKLPIRQLEFQIDGEKGDPEIRKFVEENIEGLSSGWSDFIRLTLTYLEFGYAAFEKVFKLDGTDGKVKWDKFLFLPQATIKKIVGEKDGGLKELVQYPAQDEILGESAASDVVIDAEYLLVFVNEKEGDWYGDSLFRSAYGNWKVKQTLMKIDAIKHDRFGVGVPWAKMKSGAKKEDHAVMKRTLERMRSHEYAYMIIPSGVEEFGLNYGVGTTGAGTDVMGSMKYHDESMAKSVLGQFINLGTTESGSRALGASFIDLFLMALNSIVTYICEIFNKYAIVQLVDFNFGPQDEYPELCAETITLTGIVDYVEAIAKLTEKGWISPRPKDENVLRGEIGLETLDEDEMAEDEAEDAAAQPGEPIGEPPTDEPIPGEPPPGAATQSVHGRSRILREPLLENGMKYFRELKGVETHVDFKVYAEKIESLKTKYISEMKKVRDKQIKSFVYDVVKQKKDVHKIRSRYSDRYEALTREYMIEAYRQGKETTVREKAKQQGVKESEALAGHFFVVEDIPAFISDYFEVSSKIAAEIMSNRTKAYIVSQYLNYHYEGLGENEIAAKIYATTLGTGDKIIASEFERVFTSWQMGREEQARQDEQVQGGFYSAIMDGATCDVCAGADEEFNAGVREEPFTLDELPPAPNPDCEGGPGRCRCIHVYEFFRESGEDIPIT